MKEELLTSLPNIGKTLSMKLQHIGIQTPLQLRQAGSRNAFIRLQEMYHEVCIDMLYALEGAIQGIRWHDLDTATKADLKDFYHFTR